MCTFSRLWVRHIPDIGDQHANLLLTRLNELFVIENLFVLVPELEAAGKQESSKSEGIWAKPDPARSLSAGTQETQKPKP